MRLGLRRLMMMTYHDDHDVTEIQFTHDKEMCGRKGSMPNWILLQWWIGKECVYLNVSPSCAFNSYWERGFHRLFAYIYMALIPGRTGNRKKRRAFHMKYASVAGDPRSSIHMRCQVHSLTFRCSSSGNNVGNYTSVRQYSHGQFPRHMCSFLYFLQTLPTRSFRASPSCLHSICQRFITMLTYLPLLLQSSRWRAPFQCQLPADRTSESTTANQSPPRKGSS